MSTQIHSTAIIESGAELAEGVSVGPYAYIGAQVKLGKGTTVMHHATVDGATIMGQENEVHPYAYLGGKSHDKKYKGGVQRIEIGDRNVFREYTTVHCATEENLLTRLGHDNLILAYSHIAHECQIGDRLVMSSHAALGGHVTVGNHVNVGWGVGVHQFCRVGDHAMLGAASKIVQDVPPFLIADGNPAVCRTINKIGLERAGFDSEAIQRIHRVFKAFYKKGLNQSEAIKAVSVQEDSDHVDIDNFIDFVQRSDRGIA
ncbi:MAG: Acyl-[acyl-carrier-protein]--UDP-N-acetylglucosamine O-acyltransferase [Opitutia bacterium UBA7350]|nr:MAG: Acyl-[acyl-carrier-protein]--UDP-N-acetylglucosamine O-acyltransferase [Opitutae bacterium UBA7350]